MAPLADVRKLAERDDASVVLLPTGTGFKQAGTGDADVDVETAARDDLRQRLAAVGR